MREIDYCKNLNNTVNSQGHVAGVFLSLVWAARSRFNLLLGNRFTLFCLEFSLSNCIRRSNFGNGRLAIDFQLLLYTRHRQTCEHNATSPFYGKSNSLVERLGCLSLTLSRLGLGLDHVGFSSCFPFESDGYSLWLCLEFSVDQF